MLLGLGHSNTKLRALRCKGHAALTFCVPLIALLLLTLGMTACQAAESPSPQATSTERPTEAPEGAEGEVVSAPPDPDTIQVSWQGSSHADTFVVTEKGTNSTCARCHAPVNWTPSMDDIPESCTVCKFKVEPPPPLIPEEEWAHIPCKVCHRVDKKGVVEAQYAWLEIAAIDEYVDVTSGSELCEKCHGEVDLPDHQAILVAGVHEGFSCTDCHNAHDTSATCTGCHDDIREGSPLGHAGVHQVVSCLACHGAGNLEVGLSEGEGDERAWKTFLSTSEGGIGVTPYTSHNIQRLTSCDRCHFPDNPWGLAETVNTP